MKKLIGLVLAVVCAMAMTATEPTTGWVKLAWDQPTGMSNVFAHNVYWGTIGVGLTNKVQVGRETSARVENLPTGVTNWFVVTAIGAGGTGGIEGDWCSPIYVHIPTPKPPAITGLKVLESGSTLTNYLLLRIGIETQ